MSIQPPFRCVDGVRRYGNWEWHKFNKGKSVSSKGIRGGHLQAHTHAHVHVCMYVVKSASVAMCAWIAFRVHYPL
jgi:hypothetical protein